MANRKMTSRRARLLPAVVALVGSTVVADEISLRFDGMGTHGIHRIAVDGRLDSNSSEDVQYVDGIRTGERLWTDRRGENVMTFCIQVYESVAVGEQHTFDMHRDLTEVPEAPPYPGPMNAAQAGLIGDLYTRFVDGRTGYLREGTSLTDEFDDATAASAFQMVVWEIVHENITDGTLDDAQAQLSMELGAFRADLDPSSGAGEAVGMILSSIGENRWMDGNGSIVGLTSPATQDQLMVVPLPLPGVLAGIGLIGAALIRRRLR